MNQFKSIDNEIKDVKEIIARSQIYLDELYKTKYSSITAEEITEIAAKHIKIPHVGKYVPFILFEKQQELIEGFVSKKNIVTKKSRQTGVTSATALYAAVKTILSRDGENIVIFTNRLDSSVEILSLIRGMIMQLLDSEEFTTKYNVKLKKGYFDYDNKKQLSLGGNTVRAISSHPELCRSVSPSILIVDEAAFVESNSSTMINIENIMKNTQIIMNSTTNGKDYMFYPAYNGSMSGKYNFEIINAYWYDNENFDKKWYQNMKNNYRDKLRFMQEIDAEFIFRKVENLGK